MHLGAAFCLRLRYFVELFTFVKYALFVLYTHAHTHTRARARSIYILHFCGAPAQQRRESGINVQSGERSLERLRYSVIVPNVVEILRCYTVTKNM